LSTLIWIAALILAIPLSVESLGASLGLMDVHQQPEQFPKALRALSLRLGLWVLLMFLLPPTYWTALLTGLGIVLAGFVLGHWLPKALYQWNRLLPQVYYSRESPDARTQRAENDSEQK